MSKARAWLTPDAPPGPAVCRSFFVPSGEEWEAIARGAIVLLFDESNFEQYGSQTPEEVAQAFIDTGELCMEWRYCMPIGCVFNYAGSDLPPGALECDGATFDPDEYADLFAVIGHTFGTGGGGLPKLPHIQGEFIAAVGMSPQGATYALADKGGTDTHVLTTNELAVARAHSGSDCTRHYTDRFRRGTRPDWC